MKLNTNSNTYTILYAAVMVVVVAFLLAFVASSLKETQDANVLRDTKNQILTSLNIDGLSDAEVDAKYAETITDTLKAEGGDVFVATVDGATKYVLPLKGRGLWGGLWGYISLNEDKQTVYGAYFSHESETAGLGARIKEREFQTQFNDKHVFDAAGEIALTVVKNGHVTDEATQVDGVTGATLTSNGVAEMVNGGLKGYAAFLQEGAAPCCGKTDGCPADTCQAATCPADSSEVTD